MPPHSTTNGPLKQPSSSDLWPLFFLPYPAPHDVPEDVMRSVSLYCICTGMWYWHPEPLIQNGRPGQSIAGAGESCWLRRDMNTENVTCIIGLQKKELAICICTSMYRFKYTHKILYHKAFTFSPPGNEANLSHKLVFPENCSFPRMFWSKESWKRS